jgi:RNA polymerase sigma factor (sigma-70 family)
LVAFVRARDATAFEILYERHARELLSFCCNMLGSKVDGEDAVQATFASAHRALLADDRTVELRPWLFAIARNACLSILRARRPHGELSAVARANEDPAAEVARREEIREVIAGLLDLPESQRAALVLAELHGFSHSEIGALLGVRTEQVKSYVYQARSNLISERDARGADCHTIRQELATARGPALLRSRLRRHLRSCPGCQQYAADVARQRDQLGGLLPVLPTLALKRRVLDAAFGNSPDGGAYAGATAAGGSVAAATAELAGGGAKAFVAKLLAGAAVLGVGGGVATVGLSTRLIPLTQLAATSSSSRPIQRMPAAPQSVDSSTPAASAYTAPVAAGAGRQPSQPAASPTQGAQLSQDKQPVDSSASNGPTSATTSPGSQAREEARSKSEEAHDGSEEAHGKSEEAHGKGEEAHGKGEEAHGKSEEAHGKSEEAHGKSEEAHGKSEEAHGKSEEAHGTSEEAHGKSEEARGKSEEVHGKSEEVRAASDEEAHGQSGKATPPGRGEEAPGESEEGRGHGVEAVANGNSEEAHGKAKSE